MSSVLIVDDDSTVRRMLVEHFESAQFVTYQAGTAKEGIESARLNKPSAVIMDLNLPDLSGFDAVEVLKKDPATCGIPILVFTAHHKDGQLIESREHGADGYLVKGGPCEEVIGYVDLLIKTRPPVLGKITLGPVSIDLSDRSVRVSGRNVAPLTPKEFDLLAFIAQKSPQVFPWEKIAKAVWNVPEKYGKDSKTIELHAQRVRRKLGPEAAPLILTHKGVGLQFLAVPPANPS